MLLACIFLNGPQEEREHIISQLFAVFNSDDVDNIYLASRCLCEILEEASFQNQVDILVGCDSSLRNIVTNIDRSQVHIVRNIAKLYRLVAFRVCDARLANDFTADIDDSMTAIFSSWMQVVVQWCSVDMDTGDILECLGVLIEVIQFLSVVAESFPALCTLSQQQAGQSNSGSSSSSNSNMITAIMHLAWRYLHSLVEVYAEVSSPDTEYSGRHIAHDGDRIEVGVFVMHLFELLKICINIISSSSSSQHTHEMQLGQRDLNDLMSMLVRYMQLSEEQVQQYLVEGNDFVAADQDDCLELSLRHTGCEFVHEMFMSSPGRIFEAIVSKVESDLTNFYANLSGGEGQELLGQGVMVTEPVLIPEERVTQLEASLFALRCMGRKFTKRYLRSRRGLGGNSNSSAGGCGGGGAGAGGSGGSADAVVEALEREVARLQRVISGLVNTFFNDNFLRLATSTASPSDSESESEGGGTNPCKLCICRGIISSLLSSYSQILPVSSLSFLLSVTLQFSSPSLAAVECVAARLYHCSALGVLVNLAVKHFNYSVLTVEQTFERSMESFLHICAHATDSTIHIPLENITNLLNTASAALRSSADPSTPHFLPPAAIEQLLLLGLSTWATYRDDPFSVDITRELFLALLTALTIHGHYGTEQIHSRDRLILFCQAYFPPLEAIVADMCLGESQKNLGDIALRVLVEGMAATPDSDDGVGAGGQRDKSYATIISLLGVPTLQALARVFAMSLSEGTPLQGQGEGGTGEYRIDIGETLRSLSMFFSIKDLHFDSLDPAIRGEIIADVLNSAHQVHVNKIPFF